MPCLPLLALLPSCPSWFFSSMFWGDRRRSFPPNIDPCPESPPSPFSPTGGKGRGGGRGGQGSPSVLRLHRVFRLNQEIFYYQKEKRKKKIPAATFPPCPIGTVETGSVGFPGRAAQGWDTQARVVEFPVRPSARPTLGFSPLLPPFPSKQTTRGGLPLTSGPRAGGLDGRARGQGRGAAQP